MTGYRCGPAVVDVEVDDPDAARWLAEFFTPWFDLCAPGEGAVTVRLMCSAAAFADLQHRRATASTYPIACFALDSQVVELPGWTDGEHTVIADDMFACFYRVRQAHVEIVAQPGVRAKRIGLMRVVRELAAARILGQATVLDLHAAAFAVDERAVLLVGPKRAGKTTLLVSVLASGLGSLLANDRVFVDTGRHLGRAFGMPTLVSLRAGTLQLYPNLRRGFPERPTLLHTAELESLDVIAPEGDGALRDFGLSSAQLARRLGVPIVRSAPVAAIVFPEITTTIDAWSLEPVVPADGAARLRECLYGVQSSLRLRTIFEEIGGCAAGRREDQTAIVDQLAARLPLYRCRLGRDAYRDGAGAWLRALRLEPAAGECVT